MIYYEEKIRAICEVLDRMRERELCALQGFEYAPCAYKTANTPPADLEWRPFEAGTRLEGVDAHFWFRTGFDTPAAQEGKQIAFSLKTGREGQWDAENPQCIVYLNGALVQGMDVNHTQVLLEYGQHYDMQIYFYVGMNGGKVEFLPSLVEIDTEIERLYYDVSVPYEAALCFDRNSDAYIEIIKKLDLALNLLDMKQPYSAGFYKSIGDVCAYLDAELYNENNKSDAVVDCIGHTHIDVAWLWTVKQTREKAQRSFSTVLNLMKQYPEYKFMSSQPQLYQHVKEEAPELYAQIKQAVKDGRWEVEGAMWLEADCNLTSGESLVRQVMHGKRFMQEEFGVDSKVLWLPDVFGYSAALPQILKKAGVDKFVTSKISWNEFNIVPYDTFLWEGIDGTDIFTYFLTAADLETLEKGQHITTYVGAIRPSQILGTWKRYQQKEYNNEVINTFGFGDGGGGPTKDHLEQQRRLAKGIPYMPKTRIKFAGDFLNAVEKRFYENAGQLKKLPKWVGELYLELHRGTYTSIAKNKRYNRKSELSYQQAEALCVADKLLRGAAYPQEEINASWQNILLNQFHDIIPGSSIKAVYDQTDIEYKALLERSAAMIENAVSDLAQHIKTDGGLFVYNPNGFACGGVVDVDGKKQYVADIPALGYRVVKETQAANTIAASKQALENAFYKISFDAQGNITSLFDKTHGREVVKPGGKFNELQVFEDFPKCYDAWEITEYYKQKMTPVTELVSAEVVDEGARAGLRLTKRFLSSTITQTVYLYEDMRNIDFDTVIDWKEEHMLLKAMFPMDIHANEASYEIQFGYLKRPTHSNTSWDRARFEVCAHKWADLSEDDYGVSILNDCKYGYGAEGSTLSLSLLKCATYPNPAADKEVHRFTYSVYPHAGSFKQGGTVRAAYLLNKPLLARPLPAQDGSLADCFSLVQADKENVMIDTVKKAEDSDAVIVRFYEAYDRRTTVKLDFGFEIKKAYICDLLENNLEEVQVQGNSVSVPVRNFEIVTLKVEQ